MWRRFTARAGVQTVTLALLGSIVLSGPPAAAAVAGREMNMTFEGSSFRESSGNRALTVSVATRNGGSIGRDAGWAGGTAATFPAFRASNPPQAVMTMVDRHGADDLSPGTADFRIGAEFRLNPVSQGSTSDNGNNLLQRGLADSAMQYKLEVDGRRPGCRVKGSSGAVKVRSTRHVATDTWHRVTCTRRGPRVVLRVVRLRDKASWTYRSWGAIGSLKAPSASLPLSIGGKVNGRGEIITSNSDQFNGRVDNAFLNVF